MIKLGVTTRSLNFNGWMNDLSKLEYNTIEIQKKFHKFYLMSDWIKNQRKLISNYDLSLHSSTTRVFTDNQQFTRTELEVLRSEIVICSLLGIRQLIFHLKDIKLTNSELSIIKDIVKFANNKRVNLIYESNSKFNGIVALDTLDRIPLLKYNLDLGHLNLGIKKKLLGMTVDRLFQKLGSRIVYIHVHGNNGIFDQHKSLSEGNLNWEEILDLVDLKNVEKIVSETYYPEMDNKNISDIGKYLKKRGIKFIA